MEIRSGAAAVGGFRFAGTSAGLKSDAAAKDLGLIVADRPAAAAALFTTNRVKAAPVVISEERLRRGRVQAVAVNSGSANCFTGRAGLLLARQSSAAVARALSIAQGLVVPCSTGVIGHLYDLEKYRRGAAAAADELDAQRMEDFARAIMTTDTRPKMMWTEFRAGGTEIRVAGIAKGAGMIAPRMATMLGFIVTDAALDPAALRKILGKAAEGSFNAITVDGDMSTNDTAMMLASGAAANRRLNSREFEGFARASCAVASALAREMVRDGEGATKLVEVEVNRAASRADAERIARQIANSPLVKTAFFGCDPNVGRIVAAAGSCGARLDPERLALHVGGVKVAARGRLLPDALPEAAQAMRARELKVRLDLALGTASARIVTCDLSFDYVRINAEYTT